MGMKIVELALEALELDYERLRLKRPREEKRLLASIGDTGQQSPVVVVPAGAQGRYVLIDGYKRLRALRKLKADVAKAVLWEMPTAQALILAYQMQRSAGGWNAIEEGWMVYELHRKQGLPLNRIDAALDKSQGWASRRLGLVESLPERVLEDVHQGRIGAYAAMKYLLPLARANAKDCEQLAAKIGEHRLRSRQVELLCRRYKEGSRSSAQKIIADPLLFLKALDLVGKGCQDPDLTPTQNRCVNNLALIGNVSLGLVRILPEAAGEDPCPPRAGRIAKAWGVCAERFTMLSKTAGAIFTQGNPNPVTAREAAHAG